MKDNELKAALSVNESVTIKAQICPLVDHVFLLFYPTLEKIHLFVLCV